MIISETWQELALALLLPFLLAFHFLVRCHGRLGGRGDGRCHGRSEKGENPLFIKVSDIGREVSQEKEK